ncbi:dihydrofolate reductase [bacterium (Candidatus Gribaldobacteria) CG08_land_8_20_14_0_20_39_15]|uniref:Dihydrofolate reductase n=1 Tax=bacterium (Candidatus Gribaldobacteria) CG08_land_8_20_14_0_20_39_15 TaxID=2014273 RepID=A0A2M6XUQ0_9BACT|nr:MAG: dihydrofolate reductase [bacterium (Candidatus Gribaldobacteria) CG08_land_8_20_14_0_20_39_15]
MIISIIAAVGRNRVIGNKNFLPWNLPVDLEHFKQLTLGKPIIMGAKTFESIGRALPGRFNIVLAQSSDYSATGCKIATSIPKAIELAEQSELGQKSNELMVCGGQSVYEQFLSLADKMYLTFVEGDFEADTFFPDFDKNGWQEIERIFRPADEQNPYDLNFVVFTREKI